jgi:ADP-ribose pyrophosphatase
MTLDGEELHMVEQYRYPVGERFWELPQGAMQDETPESAAARELREETGVTAKRFEAVGFLHPSYGLTNHGFHVVLATGLSAGQPKRDAEEQDMIAQKMPLKTVLEMIRNGILKDGPSIAALSLLHLHGRLAI